VEQQSLDIKDWEKQNNDQEVLHQSVLNQVSAELERTNENLGTATAKGKELGIEVRELKGQQSEHLALLQCVVKLKQVQPINGNIADRLTAVSAMLEAVKTTYYQVN
jgi:hypothetical protein